MASASPPPPSSRLTRGEDPHYQLKFRLWQVMLATVTVTLTCWAFRLHFALGITAIFIAKHVLVAIFIVGMDLKKTGVKESGDRSQETEGKESECGQ